MRVTLTARRREKTLEAARLLAGARRIRRRELQHVLGMLDSAAPTVPSLSAFMSAARACIAGGRPDGSDSAHWVSVTPAARAEAETWLAVIEASAGASMMPPEVRIQGAPATYSDAAREEGAVVGFGFYVPHSRVWCSTMWPCEELQRRGAALPHINVLEHLAGYLSTATVLADPDDPGASSYRAVANYTDSSANEGASRKLASSSEAMSPITRAYATLAARHDLSIFPFRIRGALHVQADGLSRGIIDPCFLEPGWRRVTFGASHIADLLTSEAPWLLTPAPAFSARQ